MVPVMPLGVPSGVKCSCTEKSRSNFAALVVVSAPRSGRRVGRVGPGGVLVGEHDLEEGVAGHAAGGVEGFHEVFEGDVLVGVGGEVGGADAVEELAEGGVAGEVGAEDEGVDEEADEVVEVFVGAAGDGGADGYVGAGAESVQEGGECGLEHHEECAWLPRASALRFGALSSRSGM